MVQTPAWTLARLFSAVADMLERRRSRKALLGLTDEQLRDIGISRADAVHEGRRLPWDYGRR